MSVSASLQERMEAIDILLILMFLCVRACCVAALVCMTLLRRTSCCFVFFLFSNLWPRRLHRSATTGRKGRCGGEMGLKETQEAGKGFAAGLEANFSPKNLFFLSDLQLIDGYSCEKHTDCLDGFSSSLLSWDTIYFLRYGP